MSNKEKLTDSNIEEIQNAELPQSSDSESTTNRPTNYMQSTMCYVMPPYSYVPHFNNQFYMMYRNESNLFNNQHLAYNNFNNYGVNDPSVFSNESFNANGGQNFRPNRKNFKQTKKPLDINTNNLHSPNQIRKFPSKFEFIQTLPKNQNYSHYFHNYQYPPNYYSNPYFINAQLASNFNSLNLNQNFQPQNNPIENYPINYSSLNEFKFKGEIEGSSDSRFFVIKSYSTADVIHGIKKEIWCSTENGNKKLNEAFSECSKKPLGSVYLFFSVNGSGHFCGMAEMMSEVDFETKLDLWAQDKWKGKFSLNWIFVKDIPNRVLKHIILPNNENKPITKSRDTQEVFLSQAIEVVNIFRAYKNTSNIMNHSIQTNANEHINNMTLNSGENTEIPNQQK